MNRPTATTVLSLLTLLAQAVRTCLLREPTSDPNELMGVARLALEAGDAALAALALERASERAPLEAGPLLLLARVHERHTGQLERALVALLRLGALGDAVPEPLRHRSARRAARLRRRLAVLPLPFPPGTA